MAFCFKPHGSGCENVGFTEMNPVLSHTAELQISKDGCYLASVRQIVKSSFVSENKCVILK